MLLNNNCKALYLALLLGLVAAMWPGAYAHAQQGKNQQSQAGQSQQKRTMTAEQAAAKARAQYGGKVLKVTPGERGYRVKLLTESGRIHTVTIQG